MQRRKFLSLIGTMPWLAYTAPYAIAATRLSQEQPSDRYVLIPGYQVNKAVKDGVVKAQGNLNQQTMVSRLDLHTGKIIRKVFPIKGHEICLHPNGETAFFACQSQRQILSFNLHSLEIEQQHKTYGDNFVGGGHALYSAAGDYLICTERQVSSSYQGKIKSHYGQVTVRDSKTLKVIQVYSSQGILPHELQFLNQGKQLAIAHYGSVLGKRKGSIETIQPAITILDTATGQLVDKYIAPVNQYEIRHLTVRHPLPSTQSKKITNKVNDNQSNNDSVISVTNRLIRENDKSQHYPAPAFLWQVGENTSQNQKYTPEQQPFLHRSQSIVFEPQYDEALVSVTEADQIAVLNAATGQLKQTIDCRQFNLQRPRGLALLNHPKFYAVAGAFRGIVIIQRGNHKPVKYFDTPLYQHSHISIA